MKPGSIKRDQILSFSPWKKYIHNASRMQDTSWDDLKYMPFFRPIQSPLNCTVFFGLKRLFSENNGLNKKLCRALAPFPLEGVPDTFHHKGLRRRTNHEVAEVL